MRSALAVLLSALLVVITPVHGAAHPDRISEPATSVAAVGSWHPNKIGFLAQPAPRPKSHPSRSEVRISKATPTNYNSGSSPKAYARARVGSAQYGCLLRLWNRESGWSVHSSNPSSGAYGIPQSLPGSKMASAGADWRTNGITQVRWGLSYISGRYGTPCGAWAHSQSHGWY